MLNFSDVYLIDHIFHAGHRLDVFDGIAVHRHGIVEVDHPIQFPSSQLIQYISRLIPLMETDDDQISYLLPPSRFRYGCIRCLMLLNDISILSCFRMASSRTRRPIAILHIRIPA